MTSTPLPDPYADDEDGGDYPADGTVATREPVLDQARIVSTVTGVLTAILGLAGVLGYVSTEDSETVIAVVIGLVGAAVTVVNVVVPIARGRIAREQVTPWPLRPGLRAEGDAAR